jgi:hypothetical protein
MNSISASLPHNSGRAVHHDSRDRRMSAPTIAITSTTNGALPYGYLSIGDTARPFGENPV